LEFFRGEDTRSPATAAETEVEQKDGAEEDMTTEVGEVGEVGPVAASSM
jgi:hypothetical protein